MENQDSTAKDEVNGTRFDGSAKSWACLIERTNVGAPGDLLVIFGQLSLSPHLVSGLIEVSEHITDNEGKVFYSGFSVLVPPEQHNFSSIAKGVSKSSHFEVGVTELTTCDLEGVVNALSELPEKSIVFLAELSRVRANHEPAGNRNSMTTWTGITHRVTSASTRGFEQLEQTVINLLDLARNRQFFIVALCDAPVDVGNQINAKLSDPNTFFYGGLSLDSLAEVAIVLGRLADEAASNPEDLEKILDRIDGFSLSVDRKALAKAQIIFGCGHYEAAWMELEPHLDSFSDETGTILLTIGHSALAAGRIDQAKNWIELALGKRLDSFEDIHRGYLLARELDYEVQCEILFEKLCRIFPRERQTIELRYQRALTLANYSTARDLAFELKFELDGDLWDILAQPSIGFEQLEIVYERAVLAGKGDWCAIRIAFEQRRRSEPDGATYWANKVDMSSGYGNEAIAIRIWAFGRGILHKKHIEISDIVELMTLLDFVAAYPARRKARFELEDLIQEQLTEVDRVTLLGGTLMKLLSECPIPLRTTRGPGHANPSDPTIVFSVVSDIMRDCGRGSRIIGAGSLKDDLACRIDKDLMEGFLILVEHSKYSTDASQHAHMLLFVADILAATLEDPTSDLIAAQLIVQRLARSGQMQVARNVSEEVLRALPVRTKSYREWRLGLSWIVYSEAFALSGNNIAALLTLCLGFSVLRKQVIDCLVICDALRICTRVLRDVGLIPLALDTLEMERDIRVKIGSTSTLWQLDQLKLSLVVKDAHTAGDYPKFLEDAMRQLEELPEGCEKLPVASLAVSLVRRLRHGGFAVDVATLNRLRDVLSDESGIQARVLLGMLDRKIDKNVLLSLLEELGNAIRREDASSQVRSVQILSEDALSIAEENEDVDLFFAAAALQSQPGLTLSAIESKSNYSAENRIRERILESITTNQIPTNLDAQLKVLGGLQSQDEYNISFCCKYTYMDLQSAIKEDEQVVVLAIGANESCFSCVINKSGTPSISRMPSDIWDAGKLVSWREILRSMDEKFKPDAILSEVASYLRGAKLGVIEQNKRLIIIPVASLFGFPFSFLESGTSLLGLTNRLCVVPSVGWLCLTRARDQSRHGRWVGWIGSDLSVDPVIIDAKRILGEQMAKYGVTVNTGRSLDSFENVDLAFFVSHGVKGHLHQIRSVTDGEDHLGAGDVARALGTCSCVILCVCHGAVSTTEVSSSENQGLLSALFASGVQTVIAAPWTVSLNVLERWIPSFLEAVKNGICVGDAASIASAAVEMRFPGIFEWARMQVYGDPSLKL